MYIVVDVYIMVGIYCGRCILWYIININRLINKMDKIIKVIVRKVPSSLDYGSVLAEIDKGYDTRLVQQIKM